MYCPYKKIHTIDLRLEENSLMISNGLAMLFNTTKQEVIMIPGCPQLTILHMSLGTVFITFDKRADGLPDILSRDICSEQDLLPTLKYLEHQNAQSLRDLHEKVDRGGCSTWLRVQNDQEYLHPVQSGGWSIRS